MNNCRRQAIALIKGGEDYPDIRGKVVFYQRDNGVIVDVHVSHLPENSTDFFGFHIHEGNSCAGDGFAATGGHYNPKGKPHPMHAGDLPPLLSCSGNAYMRVMTNRFRIKDIIGKTVVIHKDTDDFHSQPSGNAGDKIACGVIR